MQPRERLLQLVFQRQPPRDSVFVFLDVQPLEDGLVEHPTLFVVAPQVQRLRVREELQAHLNEPSCFAEVVIGNAEPLLQPLPLPLDVVQATADLGLWQGSVGRQVEQVVLACVQLAQFR
ncbi:hypothetical protein E4N62_36140 [Streptomyces sp. MNU76]|uniref:hypothetical protein n=1 Tax=Streptomyces sp. MNU76 TaxID=2560026 RepID=UPI001E496367|nr:hypothetical protein [Streptomyces sp. MNU76]MCC9710221.1 hypothetical protein [Streptomyces sp. MNU76]